MKCHIINNTRLDIVEGIDLMIVIQRNSYGICFSTDTDRAFTGRKAKVHKHTSVNNVRICGATYRFQWWCCSRRLFPIQM